MGVDSDITLNNAELECNEAKPTPRTATNTIQAAMLAALTTATCEALPDGKFLHTYTAKKTA